MLLSSLVKTRAHLFRPWLYSLIALVCSAALSVDGRDAIRLSLPLPAELPATGTFGEYRSGHFHAGLDFSTRNELGWPVRAAADGEVVRLKVQARGYGRAIYVRHANGFETVYGHLHRFENKRLGLEDLVAEERRRLGERYPGDLYPPQPIPVQRGQVIGVSGEKGSGPAHLHFELRRHGAPVDPVRHGGLSPRGFAVPEFKKLWVLPRGPCRVDGRWAPVSLPFRREKQGAVLEAIPVLEGGCDLAVEARVPGSGSMGLSRLSVDCGEGIFLRMDLSHFTFEQHNQVGLLYDPERSTSGRFLYRLRPAAGLELPGVVGRGFDTLRAGVLRCHLKAESSTGEERQASFALEIKPSLVYSSVLPPSVASFRLFDKLLMINENSAFDPLHLPTGISALPGAPLVRAPGDPRAFPPIDGVNLEIQASDLFSETPVAWAAAGPVPPAAAGLARLSTAVRLEPAGLFLREEAQLSFHLSGASRAGFFRLSRDQKRWIAIGGKVDGSTLVAGTRQGGTFVVLEDNSPPRIQSVHLRSEKRLGARRLVFPIDEIGLGIEWSAFQVFVDGKPVTAEYDPDRRWGHVWLAEGLHGAHSIEAHCQDRAGNKAKKFQATVKL